MSNIIRAAQPEDVPEILKIVHDAFTKYARDLKLPNKVQALNETEEIILQEMQSKRVLVCLTDGVMTGTIRYEILPGNIAYISRVGVRSSMQKNGVGRELLQTVIAECIRKDVYALALHTCSKMKTLIRFYYGQNFYIHSTTHDRGYIRALLLRDLVKDKDYNLDFVNMK
jgi:N-acetylglutamate synthase-like GNAT family acetyltransferase